MSVYNKIIWSEGLFLRPQHFQQQGRYFERLLETRCFALRSHPWGCIELEFERDLLSGGEWMVDVNRAYERAADLARHGTKRKAGFAVLAEAASQAHRPCQHRDTDEREDQRRKGGVVGVAECTVRRDEHDRKRDDAPCDREDRQAICVVADGSADFTGGPILTPHPGSVGIGSAQSLGRTGAACMQSNPSRRGDAGAAACERDRRCQRGLIPVAFARASDRDHRGQQRGDEERGAEKFYDAEDEPRGIRFHCFRVSMHSAGVMLRL